MKKMSKSKIALGVFVSMAISNSAFAFPVNFASGTPVSEAVRALGFKAGINVVINGDLEGTISMNMDDTDFDTALRALARTNNFSYEYVDNMVLVAPAKSMKIMETYKLKHLDPEAVKEQLKLLVEDENDVTANVAAHSISVAGSAAVQDRIRTQLEQVDVAQQQVNIKATVIEINQSKARDMGLSFFSDPWSKNTSVAGYNGFKFSVQGAHQENLGKGNVLARPNITTFDGHAAFILMGDKVPLFTTESSSTDSDNDATMTVEYKEVGVKLEVLPRINDEDKETITMTIKPSVSTITQWIESGNNKAPQISERSAATTLRVKSGETILLGGLLKEEEMRNIKQIPFLSKLPVLGEIFKSRSIDKKKSEIVIAITPTIIYDEDGRPKVELQKIGPEVQKELHKMQERKELNNVNVEQKFVMDARNDELQLQQNNMKNELTKKDEELKKLRNELRESNKLYGQMKADKVQKKSDEPNEKSMKKELEKKDEELKKLRNELKENNKMMEKLLGSIKDDKGKSDKEVSKNE